MIIDDAAASGVVFKALWRGENEIISCGDDYCVKKWDNGCIATPIATHDFKCQG